MAVSRRGTSRRRVGQQRAHVGITLGELAMVAKLRALGCEKAGFKVNPARKDDLKRRSGKR
jgi:hypothetical protein